MQLTIVTEFYGIPRSPTENRRGASGAVDDLMNVLRYVGTTFLFGLNLVG